jgi:CRP/FNR family transcriptional regulator
MAMRELLRDSTNAFRLFEEICAHGDVLWLRPQQRVPPPPVDKLIVLREGMLAVDAMPAKEKFQVLDFLAPGDVVSTSNIFFTSRISLRAITTTALVALTPHELYRELSVDDYRKFLVKRCFNQLARVNIHQLIIGRLETEARVASFLLALALKSVHGRKLDPTAQITVALPMSRVDIANYLVINCDTFSRTMSRLGEQNVIERVNRHNIRVLNLGQLQKISPISSLLAEVFLSGDEFRDTCADLIMAAELTKSAA